MTLSEFIRCNWNSELKAEICTTYDDRILSIKHLISTEGPILSREVVRFAIEVNKNQEIYWRINIK